MTKFNLSRNESFERVADQSYTPISGYTVETDNYSQPKSIKFPSLDLYKKFQDGMPVYLARHYWWAYLWPFATWFFDHQPIINAILFGQYKKLMNATMTRLRNAPSESTLQLTCVYGELTRKIIETISPKPLHIADAATVQLELAKSKAPDQDTLIAARMNAEHLSYQNDTFSTVVLFFLLHEMPEEARVNVLSECMRVIPDGGVLLVTEYAPLPKNHLLYRFAPSRWLITKLEPFLDSFWHTDVTALLNACGELHGKKATTQSDERIFFNFYRVTEYKINSVLHTDK